MKIIISADTHNGAPGKLTDTIWSMDIIYQYAKQHEIKNVIILGDLFHDRVNLNIEVTNAVYDQLKKARQDGQIWYSFCGNHDLFLKNSWKINSLHIFQEVLNIIEQIDVLTIEKQQFKILPFIHNENEYMAALNQIEHTEDDILLTHIGVKGATLNECFLLKHWGYVTFENTKYKRIFTGHFHCYQEMGKVIYPGSPIPFRYDEGVVDHGFIVYDTETNIVEFIKIFDICKQYSDYKPPDYITIVDTNLMENIGHINQNNIKIILSKDYTKNELNNIRTALTKKGAKSINWIMPKKEIEEATVVTNISQMKTPDSIFQSWVEHDNPEEYNKELLLTIHKQVYKEAEERIVIEDDIDGN